MSKRFVPTRGDQASGPAASTAMTGRPTGPARAAALHGDTGDTGDTGTPFVTGVAVSPELAEPGRGPGGPAQLELNHTAGSPRPAPVSEPAKEIIREAADVAALDVGKASLVACTRVPHQTRPGRRRQAAGA